MAYTGIQLGKDLQKQIDAVNTQTRDLIASQLASTSAIIASQERIAEGIDEVACGIKRVEKGIYGLQAAFEWGISEVVWQIEQNREVLRDILEVLSAPLNTQAKELRKRAEEAYANGWIDDALEDFLESEHKNRYDFTIHISLGMIYLFHKNNQEKALEYFEKAIKYAKPKSSYHTSYALLYKALIKRNSDLIEEAEYCTAEAIELAPDFAEALFQNALDNALLNKPQKVIPLLQKAITHDVNYCEKIHNERSFDTIRDRILKLFEMLREQEATRAKKEYSVLLERVGRFTDLSDIARERHNMSIHDTRLHDSLKRVEELIRRHSYRDYLEANSLVKSTSDKLQELIANTGEQIQEQIISYEDKIEAIESSHYNKCFDYIDWLKYLWYIAIPVGSILGLRGCYIEGPVKNGSLFDAFGTLFVILVIVALVTAAIHGGLYLFFNFYLIGRTPSETHPIRSDIEHIENLLSRLNKV